ncbi:MAG: 16S rRNA (guanine(966)-N(2))-methyltransferase RsmD [Geodermatophilaceae bacterium]|nr:16S rRNA (guanine(966)-N(2))-methyltransferase RsmD [Geodermatophilaceae bacterium]
MTRIVAGVARGRRLTVPRGELTRPTSDRAREALFSTIDGLLPLSGARVLDLYAGSGALGLEALSRGAVHALLVEGDRRVAATLRANIDSVALQGAIAVISPVQRLAAAEPAQVAGTASPYDVVFADPPYRLPPDELGGVLADLYRLGWLAAQAVLVVERSSHDDPWVWPTPLQPIRDRRYGEAVLWYGRAP